MSAANTLSPGHLASSVAQTSPVVEAPKPNELPGRLPTLNRLVQKLKTPIPQQSSGANRSNAGSAQQVIREKQQTAADQVDASELASAVTLQGGANKRKLESKKDNVRFFKALTKGAPPDFMEMFVPSVIDSVADKSATKSLVDSIFEKESPQQRALLKFILLEVAISDPDTYGVSASQLDKLTQARNALYERHGEFIEQSKLGIDLAEATAPRMRVGLKHEIKAFQMLATGQQAGTGMADFMKVVMASSNKDVRQVLTAKLKHWENLAKRDRNQYSADVTKYRQYIMNSVVNQIKSALAIIFGLDKIAALCEKQQAGSGR